MQRTNIKLINIIDNINNTTTSSPESFIFNYKNRNLIISVHHFKSITQTILNTDNKYRLELFKKNYWNELQIFNLPINISLLNIKPIKNFRTRFMKKNTPVFFSINDEQKEYLSDDYEIIHHTHIQKSIYQRIILSNEDDINIKKFLNSSGSPVFDSNNNLIGIFSKMRKTNDILYGYVIPVIYLIKTLEKTDNENLYYLNVEPNGKNKIGNYEIDNDNMIYYNAINYKIPLEIYYSLEGDINKSVVCNNMNLYYEKYTNIDISLIIDRKDKLIKLNTALFIYLITNKDTEYYNFITRHIKNMNDIWLYF